MHQLRRVEASVDVAGVVAAALARYDVDTAQRAIEGGDDLPVELADSYRVLLANLRSYRVYLPEIILPDTSDGTNPSKSPRRSTMVDAPAGGVCVGMVFSDIQSSTALWESYPDAMYQALRTHNATLRQVAWEHQGYEVKIIGDALMLAFAKAQNAVMFGAEAQLKLVQSEWPSTLCEHPLCRRVEGSQGVPLWHGVRVRIGINWGPVQAELNPVNGRFDFFGTTVNTASRVEAALRHGGLTGVTKAVLDAVGHQAMGTFFTASLGDRELKGVSHPVPMYVVLPQHLAGRWAELQDLLLAPPPVAVAAPVGDGWGGEVNVAMVFTDIQSSTALWEAYPDEMYQALRTHNA
eukprot:Hpha_TRINITY_DN16640_c1_g1::TRINITY_DN16640_c1_g1_i2::g.183719::m.183719